eukprot:jgi/Psemu1/7340/gm1.7340_g
MRRFLIRASLFYQYCTLPAVFRSDAFAFDAPSNRASPNSKNHNTFGTCTTSGRNACTVVAFSTNSNDNNDADHRGDTEKHNNAVVADPASPCRDHSDIIVIGGGLVGAALGVALSRKAKSKTATIYEQAQSLRRVGAAIGLYPNGLSALEYIAPPDVLETVRDRASPCLVFERRDAATDEVVRTTHVPNLQNETAPIMYAWFLLQQHLAEALPEGCLQLGHTFQSYELLDDGRVSVCLLDQNRRRLVTRTCNLLIGADGIHSGVRRQLLGKPPTLRYYGKVMYRSVLDKQRMEIEMELNGVPVLDIPDGCQVSWQGHEIGKSFSIRETTEGILTVTAAALADPPPSPSDTAAAERGGGGGDGDGNQGGDTATATANHRQRLRDLFSEFPPTVRTIIDRLSDDLVHEDYLRDVDIPDEADWCRGPVVLVGDAAHAMTPGMGQGANQGLEDVCELVEAIARDRPLSDFVRARIDRVTEIQERSAENTRQSNTFTKETASTPFSRRNYTSAFKEELYRWKPVLFHGSSYNQADLYSNHIHNTTKLGKRKKQSVRVLPVPTPKTATGYPPQPPTQSPLSARPTQRPHRKSHHQTIPPAHQLGNFIRTIRGRGSSLRGGGETSPSSCPSLRQILMNRDPSNGEHTRLGAQKNRRIDFLCKEYANMIDKQQ